MKNQTNQVAQTKLQFKSAKNYFASLILVLCLFFSFTESGVAQCPPGYTFRTLTGIIPGSSPACHYKIEYCYACVPGGYTPFSAIVTSKSVWSASGSCNLDAPGLDDYLKSLIVADYRDKCTFPPCSQGDIPIFTVATAMCVKSKNTAITINGDTFYSITESPCQFNSAYCVSEYRVCLEYNVTPACPNPVCMISTFIRNYSFGTPNCSPTIPPIPPIGKTWFEEWETDCYTAGCN